MNGYVVSKSATVCEYGKTPQDAVRDAIKSLCQSLGGKEPRSFTVKCELLPSGERAQGLYLAKASNEKDPLDN